MKLKTNDKGAPSRGLPPSRIASRVPELVPAAAARWRPVEKLMLAAAARGYFQ